jgi:hypothetical protein
LPTSNRVVITSRSRPALCSTPRTNRSRAHHKRPTGTDSTAATCDRMEPDQALTERSRQWPATEPTTSNPNPKIPQHTTRTAWPTALPGHCPARSPDARAVLTPKWVDCALNAELGSPGLSVAPTATGPIPSTAHAADDAPVRPAVLSPTVLTSGGPVVALPNGDPRKIPSRKKGDHFRWC